MINIKTQESPNNSNETPFLMSNDSSMKIALEVLTILNNTGKIRIKGKGETCSSAVSVANIITEIMLKENSKTEKSRKCLLFRIDKLRSKKQRNKYLST